MIITVNPIASPLILCYSGSEKGNLSICGCNIEAIFFQMTKHFAGHNQCQIS